MKTTDVLQLLDDHAGGTFLEFSAFNGRSFGTCHQVAFMKAETLSPASCVV